MDKPPAAEIRIVSGGQTGVDRAGLDTAIALGLDHGGWCPRGRLAEDGTIAALYQLRETDSPLYAARTEQNVIDSVEAQLPAGQGANLQEVTSVLTKTAHINLITGLVTSAPWYDSLPAELQTVLRDEALKAGDIASYGTQDALAQIEADLVAKGMTVNAIDVTPFKDATAGVYDKLGYGALRDELQAIAAQ